MKKDIKKLSIRKVRVSNLTSNETDAVKGGAVTTTGGGGGGTLDPGTPGILSIGVACSERNSCARMTNRGTTRCSNC